MLTSTLLSVMVTLHVVGAIRLLKEGPMIDAEGREYKTLKVDKEQIREPEEESTIEVKCTDSSMIIVVQADLFRTGHVVSAEELFVGPVDQSQTWCRHAAAAGSDFIIQTPLQDCGSILTISEDSLIYSNNLIVIPAARHHGITRTPPAVIPVSCHYKRTHFVSSNSQLPPQTHPPQTHPPQALPPQTHPPQALAPQTHLPQTHPPQALAPQTHPPQTHPPQALAPQTQDSSFSLKLMNGDWTQETPSTSFYLGDLLHLQASYSGPDSAHRQIFIDSCVATLSPDATSEPRYYFIENYGCLTEAKDGGTRTHFRPRTRADVVQLQMDVFLFQEDSRNLMFLTCQLRASPDMWRSSSVNKACNYVQSRWINEDGGHDVCRCCDTTCPTPSPKWRDVSYQRTPEPEDLTACITLGPLTIYPRNKEIIQ